LKFTEKGEIEFGYREIDSKLEFYVKDTGVGIPREKQTKIFSRFQQEENSLKKQQSGTGLGLSISKGLVDLMGGSIWVDSEQGKGTTFFFTIPCKPADKTTDTKEKNENISLERKKILIVEDDQNSYDLLSFILQDFNCKIIHNRNGSEALETVKKENDLDLVLMDIRLPKMDGLEATKEIRKITKTLPVIAQSAYAMQEDKKKCIDAGCDDFISKPLDKESFLNLIAKYL
jgi:CheY-like chemotaxis protein